MQKSPNYFTKENTDDCKFWEKNSSKLVAKFAICENSYSKILQFFSLTNFFASEKHIIFLKSFLFPRPPGTQDPSRLPLLTTRNFQISKIFDRFLVFLNYIHKFAIKVCNRYIFCSFHLTKTGVKTLFSIKSY